MITPITWDFALLIAAFSHAYHMLHRSPNDYSSNVADLYLKSNTYYLFCT